MPSPLLAHWSLDPAVVFLNHGSFGACPRVVMEEQTRLRAQMERQPVQFFSRELGPLLDDARRELASFVGGDPELLAFVPNATTAVNAVLRSLDLAPGDELLTLSHAYNACRNALTYVADRTGARVVVVDVPFPLQDEEQVMTAVLDAVTSRTRLALLDHITSPTGLVLPLERLVRALRARGVESLVDGAHAPGHVALDLKALDAAWYTGNCHKWLFAPKGAAFLHVRRDLRDDVRPTVISHGANAPTHERSRYHLEFDWAGTTDFTPYLSIPAGLRFGAALVPGGWEGLRQRNRALALAARSLLCERLDVQPPCPDDMIGALASVPLPDGEGEKPGGTFPVDPLQRALLARFAVEVPIVAFPRWPKRLVRVSAQAYNSVEDYRTLADGLSVLLTERQVSS